ncbi:hypothetical protein GRAN_0074 [Granulicella sibirica]|uniref:Uncharacterized protein n=1 Tax=Granulicella sibirica TaxID=2479048 RepID=A0A4V1L5S3_9BACT|nr:hypothetical protein GRAN_0074 [Granulicella sibirica]
MRGTQSFVHTLSTCWNHASYTALEVLWRWAVGIPTLAAIYRWIVPAIVSAHVDWAALRNMTILDPVASAATLGTALSVILPPVLEVARWLAPALLILWILISSIGRTVVLRHADPTLHRRPATLIVLQTIRLAALLASFFLWFRILETAAAATITNPIAANQEPNLVGYCAAAIVTTLVLFVLWAVLTYTLSVAPLLAMLRNLGPLESLRAAFRLGPLKSKLVEINLVMGIVKIALIVLAMVFSACPLPFEAVATPQFLTLWCTGVTVVYLIASDFFHVARLVAYLQLWRAYESKP